MAHFNSERLIEYILSNEWMFSFFKKLCIYFMSMGVLYACTFEHPEMASNLTGLKLWMVVNH